MQKTIRVVKDSQLVNMGGHIIDQPLPMDDLPTLDPFLLIHHWKGLLVGDQRQNEVGVGPHPHRGFSPITFVYKGDVVHRDSLNNKATVGPGGTQWMFAGRGVTHSERHSKKLVEEGGEVEFIQFWVNVPAKHKMEMGQYLPLTAEETPTIESENSFISVVAGNYQGIKGKAPAFTNQILLRGDLKRSGKVSLEIPETYNCLIYLLDGGLMINGVEAVDKQIVVFENDGDTIDLEAKYDTRYIVLSGEPIGENVEQYGPFVMNSQTEILQAMRDAQIGKMGILIEEFD